MVVLDQHGSEVRKKNYEAAAIAMISMLGCAIFWDCDLSGWRLARSQEGSWLVVIETDATCFGVSACRCQRCGL